MSRGAARRAFTGPDLKRVMGRITFLSDRAAELVDEHPDSYEDIEAVMGDQADLVTIDHRLTQLVNFKGC
jgi:tRNA-splicing ligase RtcB